MAWIMWIILTSLLKNYMKSRIIPFPIKGSSVGDIDKRLGHFWQDTCRRIRADNNIMSGRCALIFSSNLNSARNTIKRIILCQAFQSIIGMLGSICEFMSYGSDLGLAWHCRRPPYSPSFILMNLWYICGICRM